MELSGYPLYKYSINIGLSLPNGKTRSTVKALAKELQVNETQVIHLALSKFAADVLPAPGDIMWCPFPELTGMEPGPKPRPALVLRVARKEDGDVLSVVYSTSQNLHQLKRGELAVRVTS